MDAEVWTELALDEIDDAEFLLESAKLESGKFVLRGNLDWVQSASYMDDAAKFGKRWPSELRRRYGRARRLIQAPLMLTVDGVTSYKIEDTAGVGVLVLGGYHVEAARVTFVGVIPCVVEIVTSLPQSTRILRGRPDTTNAEDATALGSNCRIRS